MNAKFNKIINNFCEENKVKAEQHLNQLKQQDIGKYKDNNLKNNLNHIFNKDKEDHQMQFEVQENQDQFVNI